MPDALLSRLGPVVFGLTAIFVAAVIIRYAVRLTAVTRRLEKEYRSQGIEWSYWADFEFRKTLFLHPELIVKPTDSATIRSAKEKILAVRASMWPTLGIGIAVAVAGFLATICASFLSLYLRNPH
jgi:hypothetical protein